MNHPEFFTKCPQCLPRLRMGRRAAIEDAIARSKRRKGKWPDPHSTENTK